MRNFQVSVVWHTVAALCSLALAEVPDADVLCRKVCCVHLLYCARTIVMLARTSWSVLPLGKWLELWMTQMSRQGHHMTDAAGFSTPI